MKREIAERRGADAPVGSRGGLARWIDFLAPPERFVEDPEQLRRARLLAGCGTSVLVWGPFFAWAYATAGYPLIVAGVGLTSMLIAISIFGLRRGWGTVVSGNLFTAAIFAIHGVMVLRTGGIDSPALPWLSVFVIGGVAFCGVRWGLFWGAIAALEIAAIALGLHVGISLPPIEDPMLHGWLVLAAVGGQCGVILMFAAVFELEKDRSLRAAFLAREEEKKANQAKSRFVANMSHEVRTPMNAILGLTELALSEPLESDQRDRLQIVQDAATSLLELLNDVLDLSKIEAGRVSRDRSAVAPAELTQDVVRLLSGRAAAKRIELQVEVDADVPESIESDPVGLRQVLINLVGNAIKFTESGCVSLRVRSGCGEGVGQRIRFEVTDSGPGVSLEAADRIFAPFEQADMSATRVHGGTGLGLSIARAIVDGLGGRIWLDRRFQGGARFCFDLPFRRPASASHSDQAAARLGAPQSSVFEAPQEGHLLVVEDNAVNRRVIREVLERSGFRIELAEDGIEAIDAIARARPRMILMDCQMPRMDGFEATQRIRAAEAQSGEPRIPIVGVTASVLPADRDRCFDVGMDAHVPKPIDRSGLLAVIRTLMEEADEGDLDSDLEKAQRFVDPTRR